MTDFKNTAEQKNWEAALERWERAWTAVVLAERVGFEPGIKYWSNQIVELRTMYPILEKMGA